MLGIDWKQKLSFDRDTVCSVAFIVPVIVVIAHLSEGKPPNGFFWVCCAICVACVVGAKHWWAPIGTAALYMIGPLIGVAIFQQRRDAAIGVAVCGAVLAFVWWFAEFPSRRMRHIFVKNKCCPVCNRPLQARVLHHPLIDGEESDQHWIYHCGCGECTLFDLEGKGEHVSIRPAQQSDPAT